MSALQGILEFKRLEQQKQQFESEQLTNAFQNLGTAMQRNRQFNLDEMITNKRIENIDSQIADRNRNDPLDLQKKQLDIENIRSQIANRERKSVLDEFERGLNLSKGMMDAGKAAFDENLIAKGKNLLSQVTGSPQGSAQQVNTELSGVAQVDNMTAAHADAKNETFEKLSPTEPKLDEFLQSSEGPQMSIDESLFAKSKETDVFGRTTPAAEKAQFDIDIQKKQIENQVERENTLAKATEKASAETERDLINVDLKIDSNFDSFADVVSRTKEITGAGPGVVGGTLSKILGLTKANEFVEGFEGGLIEVAAAVGRVAIPGARAVRLVDLFKKTGISINDTMESAIQTSADSFRNAIQTDMSRNTEQYIEGYNEMSPEEKRKASADIKEQSREFEAVYKQQLYLRILKKDAGLITDKGKQNFVQWSTDNPIEFNSVDEAESHNLPSGTRIIIGDDILEAE